MFRGATARDDGVDLAEVHDAGALLLGNLGEDRNREGENEECGEKAHNSASSERS